MELALIICKDPVTALDQIMYALSADPLLLGDLPEREVIVDSRLIYFLLVFRQQLPVKS